MLTLATNYDGMAGALGVTLGGLNAGLFVCVYLLSRGGRRWGWAAWLVLASAALFTIGGWLLGKADEVRSPLLTLCMASSAAVSAGVWFDSKSGLAAAMPMAGAVAACAVLAASLREHGTVVGVFGAMILWQGAVAYGIRAGAVSKWDQERAAFENRCARCGYDLAGLTGAACPECGTMRAG